MVDCVEGLDLLEGGRISRLIANEVVIVVRLILREQRKSGLPWAIASMIVALMVA